MDPKDGFTASLNCNAYDYIFEQFFLLFPGAGGVELGEDVGDGHAAEFPFHGGLSFEEEPLKDRLDLGAYRAFVIGRKVAHTVIGFGSDRTVYSKEADVSGCARQGKAATGAFLGGDQAGFHQGGKQSTDDDGVGRDAGGDFGRRHRSALLVNQVGKDVDADGEARVTGHDFV